MSFIHKCDVFMFFLFILITLII